MAEGKVLVFCENTQVALELVGGAAGLVGIGNVEAVAIGGPPDAKLLECGVGVVHHIPLAEDVPLEACAQAVADVATQCEARLVMMGATNKGKALAACVAQALGAACATECRSVELQDGAAGIERLVFGGKVVSRQASAGACTVVTFPKRSFEAAEGTGGAAEVMEHAVDAAAYGARIVETKPRAHDAVDIAAANKIVSFGRGVKKQEEVPQIRALADALDAELACTRPIAEDYHLLDHDRYVGLSGKKVKPKLYMCIGSSGVIQHIAGAQDSKIIVAVDINDKAPIFDVSDYCVKADWHDFVPAFEEALAGLNG